MNEEELNSGEERILKKFLDYNEKQLEKLLKNNGDVEIIKMKENNIKLYNNQLKLLHNKKGK